MSDIAVASRSQNDKKIKFRSKFHVAPKANCTQRRQEVSHNSLGTSYCRIPAKRTGISRKTSAFIAGRNGADREVPACFARGGTGRYGTLKVKPVFSRVLRLYELCGITTEVACWRSFSSTELDFPPHWRLLSSSSIIYFWSLKATLSKARHSGDCCWWF